MVSFANYVLLMRVVVEFAYGFNITEGEDEEEYVYENDYSPKRKRGRPNSIAASNYDSSL